MPLDITANEISVTYFALKLATKVGQCTKWKMDIQFNPQHQCLDKQEARRIELQPDAVFVRPWRL
ncbi:hypothetical protein FF38_02811 [Lucilia cuprina]|uniref:Uncharacterized protein n=1 Tax=Lucilia cuprina TaxID=7375 RepID=A0A0L0CRP0_LUCCU|nr:hypothetical protein FF38_02811 [Lucilia cuprina]